MFTFCDALRETKQKKHKLLRVCMQYWLEIIFKFSCSDFCCLFACLFIYSFCYPSFFHPFKGFTLVTRLTFYCYMCLPTEWSCSLVVCVILCACLLWESQRLWTMVGIKSSLCNALKYVVQIFSILLVILPRGCGASYPCNSAENKFPSTCPLDKCHSDFAGCL